MHGIVFALARSIGWIANWKEMMDDKPVKIRPKQIYVGQQEREFVAIDQRTDAQGFKISKVLPKALTE